MLILYLFMLVAMSQIEYHSKKNGGLVHFSHLFGLICFCFSLFSNSFDLEVEAEVALLINAEDGTILYEKNAYTPFYPASLTKMATALFVMENTATLDHKLTVSQEALQHKDLKKGLNSPFYLEDDGTMMKIKEGEILPLKSLLYGLLLCSGNDAANVIAEAMGGTIPLFMEDLNAYLYSIGCENTLFLNPHGLHHTDHKTTAYDLSLIARKAMKNPLFRKIVASERYFLPKTNKQEERRLLQSNSLVCKDSEDYYSYALGIKTGYTSHSKHNLAVAAESKGRFLIAIILGAKSTEKKYEDAKKLFSAAFSEKKKDRCIVKKTKIFSHDINGVKGLVKATLKDDLFHSYYPSEKKNLKAFIHWDELKLPIKKGQQVGLVKILDENEKVVQTERLLSQNDIKNSWLTSFKSLIGIR